jgi:pantoate--beta-alanine ligase
MSEALLPIVRTVPELRTKIAAWRQQGQRVGLVPTMGALHAGHTSLVDRALAEADHAVATIFVNPKQFTAGEDLDRYPRTEAADAAKLAAAGTSLLFAPGPDEMYPSGFATTVAVPRLADCLCGPFRPGHFAGVATVVAKLLLQAMPDIAVFGEKDYQQLLVIRRMAQDLDVPVRIVGAPTVREADGLAMSSRNAYLSPAQRGIAPALHAVLDDAASRLRRGEVAGSVLSSGRQALSAAGFTRLDYLELRDGETLASLDAATPRARLFAAAWLDQTRLIDNVAIAADS